MLERIWTRLLQLTAEFVTPDWGKIIGLIPVAIAVLVVFVLLWMFRRIRSAPKARRGKQRIDPRTPAGIHMPGPSFAPAFAAVGMFLLFLGLVFNGWILILGILALVLTLLYWLAEGLRIYDQDLGVDTTTHTAGSHRMTARRPASTCPARRGARSSGRSGCSPCSWVSSSVAGC